MESSLLEERQLFFTSKKHVLTTVAMATETAMETATATETGTAMATAMETATAMATAMETGTAMETETETGTAMETGTATAMATETETKMTMGRTVALLAATTLLTACATGPSETGAGRCPSLVDYSLEFQERAADEVEAMPEDSAIVAMLIDYTLMRDQTRACIGVPTGS